MKTFSIVLLEDSERYIEELKAVIKQDLGLVLSEIEVVRTEVKFYARIPIWERFPPNVFVIDVMIPYKQMGDSDDHVPVTIRESAINDRFYRAGIRCVNTLLANAELGDLPIVLHSILGESDLNSDPKYPIPSVANLTTCPKEANGQAIIEALRDIIAKRQLA